MGRASTARSEERTSTGCARRSSRTSTGRTTLYVVDAFAGADPEHRVGVRVVTSEPVPRALREDDVHRARPTRRARRAFEPTRSSSTPPTFKADPARDGARLGQVFVAIHLSSSRHVIIGGTSYAGEIKKSVFTLLN